MNTLHQKTTDQKTTDQKTTDQKTTDQQLNDLGTQIRAELAALYADHLARLDQAPVSDHETDGNSRVNLWKEYKEKRDTARAAYDTKYFALLPNRSRAK